MRSMRLGVAAAAALGVVGCTGDVAEPVSHKARTVSCSGGTAPVEFAVTAEALRGARSVAGLDRASSHKLLALGPGSVEARFLVMAGDGTEAELEAIRSVLDYRGVPYDVFVATSQPPLTADRLYSGDHGHYQATILTDSALWAGDGSALSAAEWIVLADYEQRFGVRRVSLNTWPDPAYGFGPAGAVDTTTVSLAARCTAAGAGVFRDVNCASDHPIRYAYTYLAEAQGSSLGPLLTDDAGHALAAVHTGSDGRESLLLMFANNAYLPHSLTFLHGVVGWASSGTYLGDRRIDMSPQVDDIFLGSDIWGGGEYRITD